MHFRTEIFLLILFHFFSFLSCRTKEKQDLAEIAQVEYVDSLELFTLQLKGSYRMNETAEGAVRVLRIASSEDPASDAYHEIKITVIKKNTPQEADLFFPGYESDFLSKCSCVILERGSVNFAGAPARHYTVSLKNNSWIGFQRHIKRDGMIVRITVEGPRGNINFLRKLFEDVIKDFKFINKNTKTGKNSTTDKNSASPAVDRAAAPPAQ